MMGSTPNKARAASHTKMYGSMADGDMDFELPTSTVEKFRKMFMYIRKNAWLSAG